MSKQPTIYRYFLYKGLLLAVVLCCLFSNCSRSKEAQSAPSPIAHPDSTFPNPTQYLLFGSGKKASELSDTLRPQEIAMFQEGDILLRKGYGAISDYIADFLKEKYPITHCGFVLKNKRNQWGVLHTVSNDKVNGMLFESLKSYCKQSQQGTLIAVRMQADTTQIQTVLTKAKALLQAKVPFDLGFDDKNKQSLYCIEMMRNIFLEVFQDDWLPKRSIQHSVDVLSMDNFFDTTRFEVIFNHFDTSNSLKSD